MRSMKMGDEDDDDKAKQYVCLCGCVCICKGTRLGIIDGDQMGRRVWRKKKLMGILEEVLRRRQNRMVSCFSLKARLGGEVDEFLFILA